MTTIEKWVPTADTFGERLLWVRIKLELSLEQAADRLDVKPTTLGTWEKGASPRAISQADLAQRYEEQFGVDRDWLLYGSGCNPVFPADVDLALAS